MIIQQISASDRTFYITFFDGKTIEYYTYMKGVVMPKENYPIAIEDDKIRINLLGDWIHLSWGNKLIELLN